MARNASYNGTIDLISGIRPKNGGTFPLMDAHDVQTREDGIRLDDELEQLWEAIEQIRTMIESGVVVPPSILTVAEINEMTAAELESKEIEEVER